jgi:hypothetical protein
MLRRKHGGVLKISISLPFLHLIISFSNFNVFKTKKKGAWTGKRKRISDYLVGFLQPTFHRDFRLSGEKKCKGQVTSCDGSHHQGIIMPRGMAIVLMDAGMCGGRGPSRLFVRRRFKLLARGTSSKASRQMSWSWRRRAIFRLLIIQRENGATVRESWRTTSDFICFFVSFPPTYFCRWWWKMPSRRMQCTVLYND